MRTQYLRDTLRVRLRVTVEAASSIGRACSARPHWDKIAAQDSEGGKAKPGWGSVGKLGLHRLKKLFLNPHPLRVLFGLTFTPFL